MGGRKKGLHEKILRGDVENLYFDIKKLIVKVLLTLIFLRLHLLILKIDTRTVSASSNLLKMNAILKHHFGGIQPCLF